MKENKDEATTNLSKFEKQFLKMVQENPKAIFEALCENDIIKPLIWQDSLKNGGKLGYRGIANKYNITDHKARWILKTIEKRISNDKC